MINEMELLAQKELREKCKNKIEVLNKVKGLFLLPDSEISTVKQVSKYYEVGESAITSLVFDNKEEIESDGYKVYKGSEIKDSHVISFKEFTSNRANYKFVLNDNTELSVGGKGIALFTKRAILRVGMLLRDSKIAKEVRNQLLNTFENSTDEARHQEIDKEKELYINIMFAKDDVSRATAINEVIKYTERYKAKAEYHDRVLNPTDENFKKLLTTSEIAKDLKMSAQKLNKILNGLHVIYKKNKTWMPYSEHQDRIPEYMDFHINEYGQVLKFTEKGRKWIIELLQVNNIVTV